MKKLIKDYTFEDCEKAMLEALRKGQQKTANSILYRAREEIQLDFMEYSKLMDVFEENGGIYE